VDRKNVIFTFTLYQGHSFKTEFVHVSLLTYFLDFDHLQRNCLCHEDVKFAPEQAMKAQGGSSGIAVLFL
jgi:hypothetical protein